MSAMPVMIVILCALALAYRYYSAFLAAKVATLDDLRETPAYKFNDGQNYHPTHKWVLFGHHFAAISGAGPLIGPVLAAQFGYLPGLLWIVVGVCLAGAVQDFLVLAASIRRQGKSLAQIAFYDIGKVAGTASMIAILFIIIIALAGLGKVVVKALGGEDVKYPAGSTLRMPKADASGRAYALSSGDGMLHVPPGSELIWNHGKSSLKFTEAFMVRFKGPVAAQLRQIGHMPVMWGQEGSMMMMWPEDAVRLTPDGREIRYSAGSTLVVPGTAVGSGWTLNRPEFSDGLWHFPAATELIRKDDHTVVKFDQPTTIRFGPAADAAAPVSHHPDFAFISSGPEFYEMTWPANAARLVPGSYWGTFTIACTIPIALFVGLWMYKIRKGHVVEASLIGGALTLLATFLGGMIVPHSALADAFNLKDTTVILAMAVYGFIASVLPVWILLCPRDYLSSFLKIGTIALLVAGTLIANPKLQAPAYNSVFASGGPVVGGTNAIFPFLFITIMCGAISGFHALVSSGTTPKMIKKESDARTIGYGAMLMEGLVGVVAMIAAASLPSMDYYGMNTDLGAVPMWQDKILQVGGGGGIEHIGANAVAPTDNIARYEQLTQESLRGRTGGAVTLAVGMAHIFDGMARRLGSAAEHTLNAMWKYWYHFAIMFEALFILTTIDTGTRIGRFLLQEVGGKLIHPKVGQTDWWPGAIVCTALIVLGWGYFIQANSMSAIWPMFGVANQMLAAIALAIVSAYLYNEGKGRYLWATVLPMLFVLTTTTAGAIEMLQKHVLGVQTQLALPSGTRDWSLLTNSSVQGLLIVAMLVCGFIVVIAAAWRILSPASTPRGLDVVAAEG